MKNADSVRVFITGASSGIGAELSRWYIKRGATVFGAARRADRLEALREECGDSFVPVSLDVTDTAAVERTLLAFDDEHGGIDTVVANAGVGHHRHGAKLTAAEVFAVNRVNIDGAVATMLALVPRMVARGQGRIVAISSLVAHRGISRHAVYCASKAFISTFAESLRVDLKRVGVSVTTVEPGWVKSEMTAKNKFPMPFLMETADAAALAGEAIEARRRLVSFPSPVAIGGRFLLPAVPGWLYERAVAPPPPSQKLRGEKQ